MIADRGGDSNRLDEYVEMSNELPEINHKTKMHCNTLLFKEVSDEHASRENLGGNCISKADSSNEVPENAQC